MTRKIIYSLLIIALACSCDKQEPFEYNQNGNVLKIIGGDQTINFGWLPQELQQDTVVVTFDLAGYTTDKDRDFDLVIDEDNTTIDSDEWMFLTENLTLPAGETTCYVSILINRPVEIAGQDTAMYLALDFDGLDNFYAFSGQNKVHLQVADVVSEPDWWTFRDGHIYYWGRYHIDVLNYMVELYDIDTDHVNDFDMSVPMADIAGFFADMRQMKAYFEENPSYHSDGTRVVIPFNY